MSSAIMKSNQLSTLCLDEMKRLKEHKETLVQNWITRRAKELHANDIRANKRNFFHKLFGTDPKAKKILSESEYLLLAREDFDNSSYFPRGTLSIEVSDQKYCIKKYWQLHDSYIVNSPKYEYDKVEKLLSLCVTEDVNVSADDLYLIMRNHTPTTSQPYR